MNWRPVVVIPVGAGRVENLMMVLRSLHEQDRPPEGIVIVADGPGAAVKIEGSSIPIAQVVAPKHEPGLEQPRNIGVRRALELWPEANAAWFVDSDVIFGPDACSRLGARWEAADNGRIIMAPYEWLPAGHREIDAALRNDPRWAMFDEPRWIDPASESTGELNVGLGCFSGNLVWPIADFIRIGGFWNEIHHGRCEDGELGLRAVAHGIPITVCADARGYHLWHEINFALAAERNKRDVPMLNARHPWVEAGGLVVVDADGRRFEQICGKCHRRINTLDWWAHQQECPCA